jgi:hypothetical protein
MFIEPGEIYLSDKLLGSKIFNGGDAPSNAGGMGGIGGIEEDDPELAEAIRQSLLESQQQQQQAPQQNNQANEQKPAGEMQNEPDEEELERLAIQMSLQEMNEGNDQAKKEGNNPDEKK